jgi:hypothetical protein
VESVQKFWDVRKNALQLEIRGKGRDYKTNDDDICNVFTVTTGPNPFGNATVAVVPLVWAASSLPPGIIKGRLERANYLLGALREAQGLNTQFVPRRKLLLVRWKRIVVDSVIGSMGALGDECSIS